MRHWLSLSAIVLTLGCDDGASTTPPPAPDATQDAAVVDMAPDADLDMAPLDMTPLDTGAPDLAVDMLPDAQPDMLPLDMAPDFEPFEAGPSPYDLDAGANPETLSTEVLADWTPVLDEEAMMKRIAIRIDTPDPDVALTVPVRLVAPAFGCPCDFVVLHDLPDRDAAPDDAFSRWALDNRIALVIPTIAPLAEMDPAFAAEADAQLVATGDVRFSTVYLWSWIFIRAATAALAEPDYFREGRIGVFGRSRVGMAATAAAVHDRRFAALNTWMTPINRLPAELVHRPEGLEGRAWRRLQFDTAQIALPINHVAHLDTRRVSYFWHVSANDLGTPGLLDLESEDREFPLCIEPSIRRDEATEGGYADPAPAKFIAMRQALFNAGVGRGWRLMTPPLINATIVNDTLTVLARYRRSPYGQDGTLWYAIDRVDPADPGYVETRWENVPMTRTDNRTFVATLPVPEGAEHMDVFTYHTDVQNEVRRYVSSGYARIMLDAP